MEIKVQGKVLAKDKQDQEKTGKEDHSVTREMLEYQKKEVDRTGKEKFVKKNERLKKVKKHKRAKQLRHREERKGQLLCRKIRTSVHWETSHFQKQSPEGWGSMMPGGEL